jgi:hypothetical protein
MMFADDNYDSQRGDDDILSWRLRHIFQDRQDIAVAAMRSH